MTEGVYRRSCNYEPTAGDHDECCVSHISTLPVFDANDSLVGILSEGDLRQRNETRHATASTAMAQVPAWRGHGERRPISPLLAGYVEESHDPGPIAPTIRARRRSVCEAVESHESTPKSDGCRSWSGDRVVGSSCMPTLPESSDRFCFPPRIGAPERAEIRSSILARAQSGC